MARVVTFGEVMLRLATPGNLRLRQASSLEMTFGGGEANVAVSLALLGHQAAFVTRLPRNELAETCLGQLRGLGVDVAGVVRGGERMGIYLLETGASQRASTVLYDRAGSAIAGCDPASFDWDRLLAGAGLFHVTGITPALSDAAAVATLDAVRAAKRLGLTVSCDLNYRKKLWSRDKAGRVMAGIMPLVDVAVGNEEDAESVFGIRAGSSAVEHGRLDHARYVDVARQLHERFGCAQVAITLRESFSASRNGWSGMLWRPQAACFARRYELDIVDRVGAGDSFAAGLVCAMLDGKGQQEAVEFAVAASALKHSIQGDYNLVGRAEVEALAGGDGSGRVQR